MRNVYNDKNWRSVHIVWKRMRKENVFAQPLIATSIFNATNGLYDCNNKTKSNASH